MYFYVHVLTKQEVDESLASNSAVAHSWWLSLTDRERITIFEENAKKLKQIKCIHEFIDSRYYDESIKCCEHCGYTVYQNNQ